MQDLVGGDIQEMYLSDGCLLVCNELGKELHLMANRRVGYDIVVGTFFIAAEEGETYGSLSEAQQTYYLEKYHEPDVFTEEEQKQATTIHAVKLW